MSQLACGGKRSDGGSCRNAVNEFRLKRDVEGSRIEDGIRGSSVNQCLFTQLETATRTKWHDKADAERFNWREMIEELTMIRDYWSREEGGRELLREEERERGGK